MPSLAGFLHSCKATEQQAGKPEPHSPEGWQQLRGTEIGNRKAALSPPCRPCSAFPLDLPRSSTFGTSPDTQGQRREQDTVQRDVLFFVFVISFPTDCAFSGYTGGTSQPSRSNQPPQQRVGKNRRRFLFRSLACSISSQDLLLHLLSPKPPNTRRFSSSEVGAG